MKYLPLFSLAFASAALAQTPPPLTQLPSAAYDSPRVVAPVDRPLAQPVSADTATMGAGPSANLPLKKSWARGERTRTLRIGPSGQRPELDNGGPN